MVTIKPGKCETHLHSQWFFFAIKHTIAANVRSSERLTHKLFDDMKPDT